MHRRAVFLAGDGGNRGTDRTGDDSQHRPHLLRIHARMIGEERTDAEEREHRSDQFQRRDPLVRQRKVSNADGDQRKRGGQNRRQSAVDVLLRPVNRPVVTGEHQQRHDRDQAPLDAPTWPAGADNRDHRRHHAAGDKEPDGGHVERPQAAISDFDDEPGRAPDQTEERIQRNAGSGGRAGITEEHSTRSVSRVRVETFESPLT